MVNEIVLQLDPSPGNDRNSEGAFADLADGRIIFAYTRFYGGSQDHAEAEIAARFSDDQGRTWTEKDAIILSNEDNHNVMSVSFLPMADGDLGLFYLCKKDCRDCRPHLRRSRDGGQTWSEPTPAVDAPGYFVLNNDRAVRLSSGRIVLPLAYHRLKRTPKNSADYATMDERGIIFYYLSDDDGQTWREAVDWHTVSCAVLQEPGVVELKNGRLWSWCRSQSGQQWSLWSDDGGEHWTVPVPSTIMSPCSPASVKRIPETGDLLMIWNDHFRSAGWDAVEAPSAGADGYPPVAGDTMPPLDPQPGSAGRTPLAAAISTDEGLTWTHRKCLEDAGDHGFCYTAIHFVGDAVLLAYCAGGLETNGLLNRLRLRRISLDSLYGNN